MFAAGRFGIGKVILATAGLVGALMLLPSGDQFAPRASTPEPASILPTSPELSRFLDNAARPKRPNKSAEEVVAEVAATPEPKFAAMVSGLDVPDIAPENIVPSSATTVAEPSELNSVRAAVNMRSGPSTSYAALMVLRPDEQVAVLAREGNWAQVAKTNGTTGWVYDRYLGDPVAASIQGTDSVAEVRKKRVEAAPKADAGTVAAIGLRTSPSSRSAMVISVEPGTPLRLVERRNNWVHVVLPDGQSGWIRTR